MSQDPQAEVLRTLGAFLVTEKSLGDTLSTVANLSLRVTTAAAFAGMLLADDRDRPATTVFTDEEAPEIDQAQYSSDRGPCLDAWRQARLVSLPDLSASKARSLYPEFADACKGHGVLSTVSLPMMSDGLSFGALNLYAREAHGFSERDEQSLQNFAEAAGALLANSRAYWGALDMAEQLNAAMSSRAIIEQAKGMLMARTPGLDAEGAFEMLRKASQRENVKLRDIAERIVERRPDPQPGETET